MTKLVVPAAVMLCEPGETVPPAAPHVAVSQAEQALTVTPAGGLLMKESTPVLHSAAVLVGTMMDRFEA